MSDEKKINEEFEELDKEFVEMVNRAENANKLAKEEIEKLLREAKSSLEFLKLIDDIKIPEDKYVVYTDGELQLIYEDGEFFLVSATDIKAERKKLKRKQAIDSYLEYFIKYQVNPIIEKRKQSILKREIKMAEKTKIRRKATQIKKNIVESDEKPKIKEDLKEKVSTKVENEKEIARNITTKKTVEQDEISL